MASLLSRLFTPIVVASVVLSSTSSANDFKDTNKSQRTGTLDAILEGYDPNLPPDYDSGTPVAVLVQLAVVSIDSIHEASMDYSMTIYLRQKWVDERLRYEPFNITMPVTQDSSVPGKQQPPYDTNTTGSLVRVLEGKLELDTRAMNKIWVPDTFFYNARKGIFHDVTVPNKLMHIFSNGTVFYSMRISLTLTCQMHLSKYPFDFQRCPLRLGSYSYSTEIVAFFWHHTKALEITPDIELPTFTVRDWEVEACKDAEFEGVNVGRFSCLSLHVSLSRNFGFYISQMYVPSVLVVILSWVSFWLDIEAIPARISLGLLTVLTMTTMSVGARSTLPRVSTLKALDVWNATCLVFVFAALLEFAYVNVSTRVEKRRMSMRDAVNIATGKDSKPRPTQTVINRQRARLVDKISRISFPSAFLAFNLFYWCFYML